MSFDAPQSLSRQALDAPAHALVRPQGSAVPVIFASPHSGTLYPSDLTDRLCLPLINLRRTEDAFMDEVYGAAPSHGALLFKANYARSYVDLNRDARELDEHMFSDGLPRMAGLPGKRVQAGLGCLPKVGSTGQVFYASALTKQEGAARLDKVHDAYHSALRAEFDAFEANWAERFLIDCHSMPSRQPGRPSLPDIVLGDRFGSSCSGRLTGLVERYFRKAGYSVARNAPYAGGYTTRAYGRPKRGRHVLQIEINRALYLNEDTVEKSRGFPALQRDITGLIEEITGFARTFCA